MIEEVTKETFGFMIFQEQIALLAHRLGDGISLEEGNNLRKLLTKKGIGKVFEEKEFKRIMRLIKKDKEEWRWNIQRMQKRFGEQYQWKN